MLIQTYSFYYIIIAAQNSKDEHNINCCSAEQLQVRDVKPSLTDA